MTVPKGENIVQFALTRVTATTADTAVEVTVTLGADTVTRPITLNGGPFGT